MNSCIYRGSVSHARVSPVPHTFQYPLYFYGLDLEELPQLARTVRGFGHNRRSVVAVHDRDYLDEQPGSIRDKLMRFLCERGLDQGVARVFLVTAARYFNYVFNPVSFYYCYRADGSLQCAVAEVNNTFKERHLYVLDARRQVAGGASYASPSESAHFTTPKAFHVSPFNDMTGDYAFSFSPPAPALDVRVNLVKEGRVVFYSRLAGQAMPFTTANFVATLARYPLAAALTMPRIVGQAAQIYFRRRLRPYTKPVPRSAMTIRTAPLTLLQRANWRLLSFVLGRLRRGTLEVRLPQGETRTFGGAEPGPTAVVVVRDGRLFPRLVRDGEIGLGEAYMHGEWETPDLTAVIRLFAENRERIAHGDIGSAWLGRAINRLLHLARPNTPKGSRRNIAAHYDLSNDFFRLFLDASMMYSCAVYEREGDSLEAAQRSKLHAIIRKARIAPEHHVLEIGSGWGGFAIEAVRQTGCRVTSVTVSEKQLELARRRVAEAGLSDRIEFRLCDYRQIEGQFDRIVSIEMLEAVGHEYLGTYFATCDRVLKPGGLAVLQVITIPDQRYNGYRRSVDWIQKHIFPGGHLPSLKAMTDAMTRHSQLVVADVENIGLHYAHTLRDWRERFLAARAEVKAQGFDDIFVRKWEYYLCYCEAAFASRCLGNLHMVLTRPGERTVGSPGA